MVQSIDDVKMILEDERFDPSFLNYDLPRFASKEGWIEIMENILSKIDPTFLDNRPIIEAAEFGQTEIIKLLLNDSKLQNYLLHY